MQFLVDLRKQSGGIVNGTSGWIPERAPEEISKGGILKNESQNKLLTSCFKRTWKGITDETPGRISERTLGILKLGLKKLTEKSQIFFWIFFWNSFRKSFWNFLKNLIRNSPRSYFVKFIQKIPLGDFQIFLE